jgi:hypothetical protein
MSFFKSKDRFRYSIRELGRGTHRGHGNVRLEASADAVVDTLRLAP